MDDRLKAAQLKASGASYSEIAKLMGRSRQAIQQWLLPFSFKELKTYLSDKECASCGSSKDLQIAHIDYILNTFQVLCRICHRKSHRSIKPPCQFCGNPVQFKTSKFCSRDCYIQSTKEVKFKICNKCKIEKTRENFLLLKSGGLFSRCKDCTSQSWKDRTARLQSQGLCVSCGKKQAVGKWQCRECISYQVEKAKIKHLSTLQTESGGI